MLFDEANAEPLKKWVIRRLEDISDADSDVLAEYVLALLKSDEPDGQVRSNCLENLDDFLREHTAPFVDDVFKALKSKSYLPGYVPPKRAPASNKAFNPSTGPAQGPRASQGLGQNGTQNAPGGNSRKRAFNDSDSAEPMETSQSGARPFKQMRGSRGRGNRGDYQNGRNFRQQQPVTGQFPNQGQFQGLPAMPTPPPGFPMDPNNPMAAMMAMQAMGFPLPGFPGFPQSGSPTGFPQPGSPNAGQPQKINERCKDYDTKGFCAAGSMCPYDHGTDHLVVPGANEEYDPANASLSPTLSSPSAQTPQSFTQSRGDRGRGRSRGRGGRHDRGRSDRGGRANYSSAGPNHDRSITSVVIEQIPEEKFSEEAVREFFTEFGPIEEITLQAYKRLAIIKYSDWASANSAYNSPKVIFDNRFVKVYWYKPESTSTSPNGTHKRGQNDPLQSPPPKDDEEMLDPEEFARRQAEAQKAHEAKAKKLQEAATAKEELDKRIKAQADERKKLLEKLASRTSTAKSASPPPSAPSATTTNGTAALPSSSTTDTAKKSASQTDVLRAKLAELEAEATSLGLSPTDDPAAAAASSSSWPSARARGTTFTPYRGRGRSSYRGAFAPRGARGARGTPGAVYRLDNRPRTVALSGPDWSDPSKEEALRGHLFAVGADFETISAKGAGADADAEAGAGVAAGSALEIAFPARYVAENFMASVKGGEIAGVGKVDFAWVANPVKLGVSAAAAAAAAASAAAGAALEGDAMNDVVNGSGGGGAGAAGAAPTAGGGKTVEVDYDVAEDDEDRWIAE